MLTILLARLAQYKTKVSCVKLKLNISVTFGCYFHSPNVVSYTLVILELRL